MKAQTLWLCIVICEDKMRRLKTTSRFMEIKRRRMGKVIRNYKIQSQKKIGWDWEFEIGNENGNGELQSLAYGERSSSNSFGFYTEDPGLQLQPQNQQQQLRPLLLQISSYHMQKQQWGPKLLHSLNSILSWTSGCASFGWDCSNLSHPEWGIQFNIHLAGSLPLF